MNQIFMSPNKILVLFPVLLLSLIASAIDSDSLGQVEHAPIDEGSKRAVTVADAIRMTKLGDPEYYDGGSSRDRVAQFSMDGSMFVVVLRKGNLEDNTNEYTLLLWRTREVFGSPTPETLLRMSSSSNREAIRDVRWLDDHESVSFLGEHPGELQQLYIFNIRTRALQKITDSTTSLLCYSMTPDGRKVAYVVKEPSESIFDENARRRGIRVSTQFLPDLLAGRKGGETVLGGDGELYLKGDISETRRIMVSGRISEFGCNLSMSPDGKYIIVPLQVPEIPETWKEYADPDVHSSSVKRLSEGEFSNLQRLELIDTSTGEGRVLLDSPLPDSDLKMLWSSDSQSVVVGNTLLPLDNSQGNERKTRRSKLFAVEVAVPTGDITKIHQDDLRLVAWTPAINWLVFEEPGNGWYDPEPGQKVFFRRMRSKWERVTEEKLQQTLPDIVLEEGMNAPPRIVAVDPLAHRRAMLLDLNPQFNRLKFGAVEEVKWKASDGHQVKGGLYYPADYIAGKRYPLVIQTHFWSRNKFWIDGPWTTAFAAQPMAGKNIMVLQADEDFSQVSTPKEAPREVAAFEGAINYLDGKGLIDRNRVGIIAFSRTCLHVKYALTHPGPHFAAASVTDGVDGGYFQYIQYVVPVRVNSTLASEFEAVNGGLPFGAGLGTWLRRSPGFNLGKVQTPLRIVAENANTVLFEWEWFAGLSRLGRPVEMVLMQDAEHILQKPWDRMISQQGNVDWFAFWLKGEEDHDPAKAEQYTRWREMRNRVRPQP